MSMISTRKSVVELALSMSARAACLATVLVFAACADSTAPGRAAPLVEASAGVRPSIPFPPAQVRAISTTSSVVVSAVLVTGTPCYAVSATDRIDGNDLIIKITATLINVPCIDVTLPKQYTVTSRAVPISATHITVQASGFVGGDSVIVDRDIPWKSAELGG